MANPGSASLIKRALIVIWLPPLAGIFLLAPLGLLMTMFANQVIALTMVAALSFAGSLVPSLVWWALMESIRRTSFGRMRFGLELAGAAYGAMLTTGIFLLVRARGFHGANAGPLLVLGPILGGVMTILMYPQRSRRVSLQEVLVGNSGANPKMRGNYVRVGLTVALAVVASAAVLGGGIFLARHIASHLPSDRRARSDFERHRSDYSRLAALIENDRSIRNIGPDGEINSEPFKAGRIVPEIRELIKGIGIGSVLVREGGAIDFELWGWGGTIVSDSYKGIRYTPPEFTVSGNRGWVPVVVASLADDKLPHENGRVATGYYIVPIDSNWSIYRFEYQE